MNVKNKLIVMLLLLLTTNAFAAMAFLVSQYVDGQSRICIYDHLGSEYIITIKAYEVCPVTIQVSN